MLMVTLCVTRFASEGRSSASINLGAEPLFQENVLGPGFDRENDILAIRNNIHRS